MLSLVMLVALGLALVACGGGSKRINAPDRISFPATKSSIRTA